MTMKYFRISAIVACDINEEVRDSEELPHHPLINNDHESYEREVSIEWDCAAGLEPGRTAVTSIVEVSRDDAKAAGLRLRLSKEEVEAQLKEAFEKITEGDLAKVPIKERAAHIQQTYDAIEAQGTEED